MDAEVLNALKLAAETLVKAATTDLYKAVASQFVKKVTRSKRAEVRARLDASMERVQQAPERSGAEAERLFEDLQPLVDLDRATLEEFISSSTKLIREAKPSIVANASVVHAHQYNFTRHPVRTPVLDESLEMLNDVLDALREGAASQQALADELVKASRLARESQKEAHAAQQGVLMMSALVLKLERKIDELTHERDELLGQLEDAARRGGDVAELERKLASAQEDACRSRDLYRQSQRELQGAVQQRELAERLADEAVNQLERRHQPYNADRGASRDLERYEQKLSSLVDERRATQERVREIDESLSTISRPLPPNPVDSAPEGPGTLNTPASGDGRNTATEQAPISAAVPSVIIQDSSRHRKDRGALSYLGAFLFFIFYVLLFGAIVGTVATSIVMGSRDAWISLLSVPTTGNKPTPEQDIPQLDFALHSGIASTTTFRAGGDAPRYFNTLLQTTALNNSCGSSATVSYAIYSDDRLISYGNVPADGANKELNDLAFGRSTQLKFAANLHAAAGCQVNLGMYQPTLDKLTGWERYLAGH